MDDTRRRFALSYLKDRRNSLAEIAFLLGYSEAAAFIRAFKRWTGLTPVAYRRQAAQAAHPREIGFGQFIVAFRRQNHPFAD
jgi:AraC-like DNA-binding protein